MRQKYAAKQVQIRTRLRVLKALFNNPKHWWNQDPEHRFVNDNFHHFIRNMEYNFGQESPAYRMINSTSHRQQRHREILEAILRLPQDRAIWLSVLADD